MSYVLYNGIKFHPNFKLLMKGYPAITLFGHVYMRRSKEEIKKYLNTYNGQILANHEHIHMLQANTFKLGYFTFYIVYIWYHFINLFRYKGWHNAYRNIPFEREAYANEKNFNYNKSEWKKYTDKYLKKHKISK